MTRDVIVEAALFVVQLIVSLIIMFWALVLVVMCGSGWAQQCVEDNGVQVARMPSYILGASVPTSSCSCPSGTYSFAWNGDYTGDSDKGCFDSGCSSVKDGTLSGGTIGATGQTGNGYRVTAHNQYLSWDNTAEDGLDITVGTVWMSVYITDDGTDSSNGLFEATVSPATDQVKLTVNSTTRTIVATYIGQSTSKSKTSTDVVTEGAWIRVGMSWDTANGYVCAVVGSTWTTNTTGVVVMASSPTTFSIGENLSSGAEDDTMDIDNVYIIKSFKAADPL